MTDLSDLLFSGYWRVLPRRTSTRSRRANGSTRSTRSSSPRAPSARTFLLRKLLDRARAKRVPHAAGAQHALLQHDRAGRPAAVPRQPRDRAAGSRSIVRWNALAMVVRANRAHAELGGHIASYASAADLFEVGYNHFFRGRARAATSSTSSRTRRPASTARAFLEGRLDARSSLRPLPARDRRQGAVVLLPSVADAGVLAVPDRLDGPRADHRDLPGALHALPREPRRCSTTAGRKVWAFVGDGEMDEPESLAGLSLAAREGLDNLIFVVNCNLQRLDGPVRGNGSVIQELEGLFAGAGWNVIKLLWGSDWDPLFARDHDERASCGACTRPSTASSRSTPRPTAASTASTSSTSIPELQALVAHLSDEDIDRLRRGGHDPVKIYAAYHAAAQPPGPAHRDPRADQEGLRHGPLGPGQDDHAPAEEARRRGAARVPRPLRAAALGRRRASICASTSRPTTARR